MKFIAAIIQPHKIEAVREGLGEVGVQRPHRERSSGVHATVRKRRVVPAFNFLGPFLAIALAIQPAIAHSEGARGGHNAEKELQVEPGRTGKERLGNKASDEQRVDNCKVPIEQRGPKPRPDTCGESVSSADRSGQLR